MIEYHEFQNFVEEIKYLPFMIIPFKIVFGQNFFIHQPIFKIFAAYFRTN